jgi:hypothetical protein
MNATNNYLFKYIALFLFFSKIRALHHEEHVGHQEGAKEPRKHAQQGGGLSWFMTRFESRGAHGCGE